MPAAKMASKWNPFKVTDGPALADITVGAETGGNTITVTVQLQDQNGKDLAVRSSVEIYLSDDANGDSLAGTAPSGGFAIAASGLILTEFTANKHAKVVSEADGSFDIDVVEAAGDTWYLIVIMPNGTLVASDAITFAP